VPRALEDVLLRRLEKDPDVGEWTQKQARGWWRDHGSPAVDDRGDADVPAASRTMSVSL
jgi:hypothetical protein